MKRAASKRPHLVAVPEPSQDSDSVSDAPVEQGAQSTLDSDLRYRMISEAAYYLYTQRGYDDGYALDDWLQAEAEVEQMIMNPERAPATEEASAPQQPD
jgi:DUF2934 family protein